MILKKYDTSWYPRYEMYTKTIPFLYMLVSWMVVIIGSRSQLSGEGVGVFSRKTVECGCEFCVLCDLRNRVVKNILILHEALPKNVDTCFGDVGVGVVS